MKILLVEDDRDQATTIEEWLSSEHHNVVVSHDGEEGQYRIENDAFDVIILDWDLPKVTGLEILKRYRMKKGSAPVIMLTGKGTISDRESGLDGGADDYLTKPFFMRELLLRIQALVKRSENTGKPEEQDMLVADDLVVDLSRKKVTRQNQEIEQLLTLLKSCIFHRLDCSLSQWLAKEIEESKCSL